MKIYAILYKYKIEVDGKNSTMQQLVHRVGENLEDIMVVAEREMMKEPGYIEYSINMELRSVISISQLLDKIQVKLPELVKSAKEREKIRKVAEALNESDN